MNDTINNRLQQKSDGSDLARLLGEFITPGIPSPVKSDSLYVVFRQPQGKDSQFSFGVVLRGGSANWLSSQIIAHYELPISMSEEDAHRYLNRK